jgi:hypothetical protein
VHACKGTEKYNMCESDMLAFNCFTATDLGMSIRKVAWTRKCVEYDTAQFTYSSLVQQKSRLNLI